MTTATLDNGLRVIISNSPSAGVYCGIAVDAGTRDEKSTESGMAHFTEHMSFKGTARRSALQIINRLECVGGELNAFTGKEETVYYCAVEPKHLTRALDLLVDIVFSSIYPEAEMRREAEVVIDEIESYNDSPSELIFDEFESMLFPDHPLGRNILGEADRLRRHTPADMAAYAARLYRPDNAVLFVSGPIDEEKVLMSVNSLNNLKGLNNLKPLNNLTLRTTPCPAPAQEVTVDKHVHQAHVMLGTRTVAASHPDRMTLVLLNNIIGGPGMNSRLNLSLRERSGLVYTVESNYTGYTDCGVWSVYFGCDQADVRRCRRLAGREMDRLMQSPLSDRALMAAKQQMRGQLALSYDQHEAIATGMGKTYLHYGVYRTAAEIIDRIESITSALIQDMAQATFAELSTLIYV